jgi:hypothetical protein
VRPLLITARLFVLFGSADRVCVFVAKVPRHADSMSEHRFIHLTPRKPEFSSSDLPESLKQRPSDCHSFVALERLKVHAAMRFGVELKGCLLSYQPRMVIAKSGVQPADLLGF